MKIATKNKSNVLQKIAAILALFLGAMSVFAGGKVWLGIDTKAYTVINGLVIYNIILGFISILVAYCIWKQTKYAKLLTFSVFTLHILVLFYLSFFNDVVASESIKAMLFRVSVWTLIIFLSIIISTVLNKNKS